MYYKYPKEYFYNVVTKQVDELDVVEISYRNEDDEKEDSIYDEIDEEFVSDESEAKEDIKEI